MLTTKHRSEFLKQNKNNDSNATMKRIIAKEEKFNMPCTSWNIEQVEEFLKDFHSITPNALSRGLNFLESFAKYICELEAIDCPNYDLGRGRINDLVDSDKLLSTVLSVEQYRYIKNQLSSKRDKCILGLAWNVLLSNDEIKKIKESDIRFGKDEDDMDIAWIKVGDREVKIEDPELVEDLDKCTREYEYILETADGKIKVMKLKDTEYLIRPTKVGRTKKLKPGERVEEYISNPSIALQTSIKQQNIACPGIDITKLSVEDIKRSKLIFMLAPQNNKYFDDELIMDITGSGNVKSQLSWLRKIARMKYTN